MTTEFKLSTDLVEVSQPNALETFTDPNKSGVIIAMVVEKAQAALDNLKSVGLYDASTEEGRIAIKSLAFKVTKSKTALEAIGKDLAKEAKELPKKIDAGRNRFDEVLSGLAKSIRAPVDAWEASEEERKEKHLAKIETIKGYVATLDNDQETIKGLMAAAEAVEVSPEKCQEFEDGYRLAKQNAIGALNQALMRRISYDRDQKDLAELREKQRVADEAEQEYLRTVRIKERDEQIAREAAEKAVREAQAAAQKEIDEANRRAWEAEHKVNEERATIAAKQKLEDDAKAAEEAETRRRGASRLHKEKVGSEASAALMLKVEGLTEKMALDVVRAIAKNEIPHLVIQW